MKYQEEKELHLRHAEQFYAELRTSTDMAKQNDSISFDFKQNFPLPHVPTGEVFYLRQIWLYTICVHECGSNRGTMYCWLESVASKGSNEVVSCLDIYFQSHNLTKVDTVHLFDSCGGQNKNPTVVHYFYFLV